MFRNQSVNVHAFSMVPRADIPRSSFRIQKTHKTTFDSGYLIPFYVDEVLPGDTFNLSATFFVRMATPIFPIMDNLYLDTQWFFVPCRLVWDNFQRFMGEQPNPGDTTDFLIPIQGPSVGDKYEVGSLQDYMGLPTDVVQTAAGTLVNNALPLRAYNLIWNEWYRDQNLQDSVRVDKDEGPDNFADYVLLKRGKRHDYFTSCLPWTQKGDSVLLPLGTSAPVVTGTAHSLGVLPAAPLQMYDNTTGAAMGSLQGLVMDGTGLVFNNGSAVTLGGSALTPANLYADLTAATAATINQIRQAFQIQKLMERDARGGTRYTEWTRAHFGVVSPDARLQRPEYLGGNSQSINISPVAQTSGTDPAAETPQGNLAAYSATVARNGFSQSFTEHGYIIGLCSVRADLTYQQGLRKMWSRRTKYDIYVPVFAMLGEQAVLNKEIMCQSLAADNEVFGYQERWAEYRHNPSMITGLFRSTATGTIDNWHLSQHFATLPTLSSDFIEENPPVERVVAVGAGAGGQQFIADIFTDNKCSRCMPMYSVPGLIDHF